VFSFNTLETFIISKNCYYRAIFESDVIVIDSFNLDLIAVPDFAGSAVTSGKYEINSVQIISAIPSLGYKFVN